MTNPGFRKPRTRYCACGCGEVLTGQRSQLYLNAAHRQRGAWDRKHHQGEPHRRKESLTTTQARTIRQLLVALRAIETRASCAPNDDAEAAGQELTWIMLAARQAQEAVK